MRSPSTNKNLEVELASPWARIAAHLINVVMTTIVCIGIPICITFFALTPSARSVGIFSSPTSILATSIVLMIAYALWQARWMSKYGQSIGKKILRIKVLRTDGSNPGFTGNVLLREVLIWLPLFIISFMIELILLQFFRPAFNQIQELGISLYNIIILTLSLIMLPMIFRLKKHRRTLQDYFAHTIVIKAK